MLLLDDKGLVFTLCLGMPHDAHADDALRAVRAGLAVRASWRAWASCAIGVAGGRRVHAARRRQRRHYWSLGVHARGGAFDGSRGEGFLCTEEVGDQVRRASASHRSGPSCSRAAVAGSGVSRPGSGYIDDQSRSSTGARTSKAAWTSASRRSKADTARCCGWSARQGSERRRWSLLQQSRPSARITCLLGAAGSVEIAVPYAAWRPVFAALLNDANRRATRPGPNGGARRAPSGTSSSRRLINAVVPGYLDETPLVRSLSGRRAPTRHLSVLSEVIGAHASPGLPARARGLSLDGLGVLASRVRVAQELPAGAHRPHVAPRHGRSGAERAETAAAVRRDEALAVAIRGHRLAGRGVLGGRDGSPAELVDEITERSVGQPAVRARVRLALRHRVCKAIRPPACPACSRPKTPRRAGHGSRA